MKKLVKHLVMVAIMFAMTSISAFAQSTVKHTVDRGETLATIAKRYGTTEARIIELNPDAAQFIYVGMELTVEVTAASDGKQNAAAPQSNPSGNAIFSSQSVSQNGDYSSSYEDDFESARKESFFEFGYTATTFDDVKASGHYGFGWTALNWKLAERFYAGLHFSPLNFNFGLVPSDYTTDIIELGPAFGYYITPKIAAVLKTDVLCELYFDENDNTKTSWGMGISPTLYVGDKCGIFLGPFINFPFSSGAKVDIGFSAGIYF